MCIQSYSPDTETARVDDKAMDFSAHVVVRNLKLPLMD